MSRPIGCLYLEIQFGTAPHHLTYAKLQNNHREPVVFGDALRHPKFSKDASGEAPTRDYSELRQIDPSSALPYQLVQPLV